MVIANKNSVHVDGAKIVYDSYGSGNEALVFVHGWTCDSSLWHLQMPLFQNYRSLLIDLPGHGRSEAPDIEYTQELFARAIEAVLRQEGVAKAVMVGHSMGGPVSTMVLRLFPQRVSAIIYVDSFFNLPETYMTVAQRKELASEHADDVQFRAKLDRFWNPYTTEDTQSRVVKTMTSTAKHVRINAVTRDALPHTWRWNEIHDIPALLLVCPMFVEIDRQWLRHIPRLEVQFWEQNGHFLFMEDPERFNKEVVSFLEKNDLLKTVH